MVVKEERFNYFLSISFAVHLLILFLLSLINFGVHKKEIPIIEVSLVKIDMKGSSPVVGNDITIKPKKIDRGSGSVVTGKGVATIRPKMLPGTSYPVKTSESKTSVMSSRREYNEPENIPLSSISNKGDLSITGVDKKGEAQGLGGAAKRGSAFSSVSEGSGLSGGGSGTKKGPPSGGGGSSGFSGGKLGVGGPAATRGILYYEYPVYPEWAEKEGIESRVKLKFWVSPEGYVDEVIVEQKGYLQLDNLAVQSLKKWRFEPLPPGEKQTRQWGTIEIIFKLK